MAPLNDEERAARAKMLADRDEQRQRRENDEPEAVNTDFKLPNPTDRRGNPQNNPPSVEASDAEKSAREAALKDNTATIVGGSDESYAEVSVDVATTQASVTAADADGSNSTTSDSAKKTDAEIDKMTKVELGKYLGVKPDDHTSDELKAMAKKK